MTVPLKVFISHSSRDKPAVEALEEADSGVIVFSAQAMESAWVKAEVSSLTWSRIQGQKVLIPVRVSDAVDVPPLLP